MAKWVPLSQNAHAHRPSKERSTHVTSDPRNKLLVEGRIVPVGSDWLDFIWLLRLRRCLVSCLRLQAPHLSVSVFATSHSGSRYVDPREHRAHQGMAGQQILRVLVMDHRLLGLDRARLSLWQIAIRLRENLSSRDPKNEEPRQSSPRLSIS